MRLRAVVTLLAAGLLPAAAGSQAAGAETPATCDASAILTPFALDTASGTALLAVGGDDGWWLEIDASGEVARSFPRGAAAGGTGSPFAGSVGPGPVTAVAECGAHCLQALRWRDGRWTPLGEPLRAPFVATVHTTFDRGGTPWIVVHAPVDGDGGGAVRAWAFRLEGREWAPRGELTVLAAGAVGAVPDPERPDAVLSGTGRFSAGAEAESWVAGLPRVPAGRHGELVPTAGSPVYLDADGRVYLGRDGGASWRRSEWTPWGAPKGRLWQPGRDWSVDLPLGDRRGALQLAWFDQRGLSAAPANGKPEGGPGGGTDRLWLTRWRAGPEGASGWTTLTDTATEVVTLDGAQLPIQHLLVTESGRWLLLYGCANTRAGSGLVLRTWGAEGLSAPRWTAIRAGR